MEISEENIRHQVEISCGDWNACYGLMQDH